MSLHVVEALEALERSFMVSTLAMPRLPQWHRSELAGAIRRGATSYPLRFSYPDIPLGEYLAALEEVHRRVDRDVAGDLCRVVGAEIEGRAAWARAVLSRDATAFSEVEARIKGLPPVEVVEEARRIAETPPADREVCDGEVPAEQMVELAERALSAYGIADWTVQVSDAMAARVSVNGALRRVRVRARETFSRHVAERLLVHEIGGHVLRWVNSRRQPEPLAQVPLGATVPTEEGLALWLEDRFGYLDDAALRTYAARVLAVEAARTHGIVEVVRSVADIVGLEAAVEIGIRVKRGLVNPNDPGGSTKDWGYLGGLLRVRAIADVDPADVSLLQGVKWSADHLALARSLAIDKRIVRPVLSAQRRLLLPGDRDGRATPSQKG